MLIGIAFPIFWKTGEGINDLFKFMDGITFIVVMGFFGTMYHYFILLRKIFEFELKPKNYFVFGLLGLIPFLFPEIIKMRHDEYIAILMWGVLTGIYLQYLYEKRKPA